METNVRDRNLRVSCPVAGSTKNVQFLQNLKNYSLNKGDLIHKFTPIYIAELIPISKLEEWSVLFVGPASKISEQQFIALFGSAVPHGKYQTLFLILSLREMYKEIKIKQKVGAGEQQIQFNWITDFLCQKITNNQQDARLQIRASQQYQQLQSVRNSPPIKYLFTQSLPYISKQGANKQKSLTNTLNKLQYSPKLQKIISLATLDNKVELYDLDLKLKDTISIDIKKQIIILSFAYSQEHQRICCLIHNFGLVFWQASDNFETKKIIQGVKADFVFYLPFPGIWGSVKANNISVWNIEQQKQNYCINISQASQVCCLQQLLHLKLNLVSIILKNKKRQLRIYSISNQKARMLSKIQISNSGCHTLLVNFATQSILQIGYSNNIKVWECDSLTFELMSLGELVGHRSIVISATNIGLSSVVATGDDKGHIKLWDLKHLRCYQTIRLSTKQIYQLINIQNMIVFGDNRISLLSFDQKKVERGEGFYIASFYDERKEKNYLFTQDSCSLINMASGKVQQIFIICDVDQQIVAVQKMKNNFFIATNRGNIINTDQQFKRKKVTKINQCGIINLISIPISNCLLMASGDGCLSVYVTDFPGQSLQLRKTLTHLPIRKLSSNSIFQVSSRNYLFSFCLNDNQIFVNDFQLLKFKYKLVFPSNVSAFKFHPSYDILIVCCEDKQIYILKLARKQRQYQIQKVLSNSCEFFSMTQNQNYKPHKNEYICKIFINKIGQLICGTNLGTVQIYDLQKYLKELQIPLKATQDSKNSQVNIFRPAEQNFQTIQKSKQGRSIYIAKIRQCPNKSIPLLISKPHITNCKQIIFLEDNRDIGLITSISSDGILRLLDFKNLQTLCMRKYCEGSPSCWIQPKINGELLKNNIIDIIKVAEDIYNRKYRPQIEKHINIQKLNICTFLSALATLQLDSVEKKSDQYNLKIKKKHIKHKSVFESANSTLKALQVEKRVRKKSCIQDTQIVSESGVINRRFKQTAQILQRKQNPIHDQFYKKSLAKKILEQKQIKIDEQCIIYDRINQKFQKWKQDKKSRSLTSFSNIGSSSLSKQQGIRDSEKFSIKTKDSDTKNVLKSKIEKLYYRNDKKSQILQKLFKKKCSHLFDKLR